MLPAGVAELESGNRLVGHPKMFLFNCSSDCAKIFSDLTIGCDFTKPFEPKTVLRAQFESFLRKICGVKMAAQWYYKLKDDEVGPLTVAELKTHAQQGRIQHGTQVRSSTSKRWCLAQDVKGLLPATMAVASIPKAKRLVASTPTAVPSTPPAVAPAMPPAAAATSPPTVAPTMPPARIRVATPALKAQYIIGAAALGLVSVVLIISAIILIFGGGGSPQAKFAAITKKAKVELTSLQQISSQSKVTYKDIVGHVNGEHGMLSFTNDNFIDLSSIGGSTANLPVKWEAVFEWSHGDWHYASSRRQVHDAKKGAITWELPREEVDGEILSLLRRLGSPISDPRPDSRPDQSSINASKPFTHPMLKQGVSLETVRDKFGAIGFQNPTYGECVKEEGPGLRFGGRKQLSSNRILEISLTVSPQGHATAINSVKDVINQKNLYLPSFRINRQGAFEMSKWDFDRAEEPEHRDQICTSMGEFWEAVKSCVDFRPLEIENYNPPSFLPSNDVARWAVVARELRELFSSVTVNPGNPTQILLTSQYPAAEGVNMELEPEARMKIEIREDQSVKYVIQDFELQYEKDKLNKTVRSKFKENSGAYQVIVERTGVYEVENLSQGNLTPYSFPAKPLPRELPRIEALIRQTTIGLSKATAK